MDYTSRIKDRISKGKKVIYIEEISTVFKLPSPQTAGTYTQRDAYAWQEAQKLNETIKKLL